LGVAHNVAYRVSIRRFNGVYLIL